MKLPKELIQHKQFVNWGVEFQNTKKPYSPITKSPDNWTNPANWGNYTDAMKNIKDGFALGIGFAFNGSGIIGIDLDNVFIDDVLIPEAADIVSRLDSFTERSQSGNGLHIYINAPGVDLGITKTSFDFPGYPKAEKRHIEFYQSTGYFAMTGDSYGDMRPMPNRAEQLKAVYEKYSKASAASVEPVKPKAATHTADDHDDRQYLSIGLKKDQSLIDLWNGQRPAGNESDDDLSLLNKLAYWTNNNAELMEAAFFNSPYYTQKDDTHQKKCDRKDYLPRTIEKAISGTPTTVRDKDAAFKLEQARKDFTPLRPQTKVCDARPTSDGFAPTTLPTLSALETISARELWWKDLPPLRYIVKDLLPQGLTILCAPSKYGKSWLSLDLCLSVAAGEPFLNFQTEKSGVLYLALEDGYRRLKKRMGLILKDKEPPDGFDMAIKAGAIDTGLSDQINAYIKEKPNTGLIVIDVLQRVRSSRSQGTGIYALDYSDMGALKNIADEHQISVLVIHHLRKMKDDADPFNMISGTNGVMGAADTIFLICKKNRDDKEAVLKMLGRDIETNDLIIEFDGTFTYRWKVTGTAEEQAVRNARVEYENDPVVKTIKGIFTEQPDGFQITSADLSTEMPVYTDVMLSPESVGRSLRKLSEKLFHYDKIVYKPGDSKKRKHSFSKGGYMIKFSSQTATSATTATTATSDENNVISLFDKPSEELTIDPDTHEVTRASTNDGREPTDG